MLIVEKRSAGRIVVLVIIDPIASLPGSLRFCLLPPFTRLEFPLHGKKRIKCIVLHIHIANGGSLFFQSTSPIVQVGVSFHVLTIKKHLLCHLALYSIINMGHGSVSGHKHIHPAKSRLVGIYIIHITVMRQGIYMDIAGVVISLISSNGDGGNLAIQLPRILEKVFLSKQDKILKQQAEK